jgi:hypothetical protein
MKWHLAHRHEISTAFDALGKEYETKLASQQDENTLLKQKLEQVEVEKIDMTVKFGEELVAKLNAWVEIRRLQDDRSKAMMLLAVADFRLQGQLEPMVKKLFG